MDKKYSYIRTNYQEVFTYTGQPATCPECGNRTEIVLDLSHTVELTQIHKCLSIACQNQFVLQKD